HRAQALLVPGSDRLVEPLHDFLGALCALAGGHVLSLQGCDGWTGSIRVESPPDMNALEVFPGVYEQWRATLHEGWRVTDPELLEQCLPRIAAAHGRAGGNLRPLGELDERGRAAAEYVDQYALDPNGITEA